MNFNGYVEDFNTNDERVIVQRWFTEDVVVEIPGLVLRGHADWIGFLKDSHTGGVRETMQPVTVVQDGDRVMAELDITFVSAEGRADFPLGALSPGEPATWKFFGVYHWRDEKIARLKFGSWPDPVS